MAFACSSGWPHVHWCMDSTNWTGWAIKQTNQTKQDTRLRRAGDLGLWLWKELWVNMIKHIICMYGILKLIKTKEKRNCMCLEISILHLVYPDMKGKCVKLMNRYPFGFVYKR